MKIFVTGASGFVGQHVVAAVTDHGHAVVCPPHYETDLLSATATEARIRYAAPDVVIHLAALVGGIGANQARPADFWRDNLQMGLNLLEACRIAGIKRLVIAGTTCSYPKLARTPFIEESLFTGYPEETNAPYGIAKLALFEGARAYRRQYGLKSIFLIPTNMYGPGDNFDLETSHVIPAMIRKLHEAKESGQACVTLWGDGTPTRDFLFVKDAAKAFVAAAEREDIAEPLNLGSCEEIPMSDLAQKIRKVVGYEGEIEWDLTKPNGQPRRCLDSSKAKKHLKWSSETRLEDGLRATYDWYLRNA